jgi:hypothetical protein
MLDVEVLHFDKLFKLPAPKHILKVSSEIPRQHINDSKTLLY